MNANTVERQITMLFGNIIPKTLIIINILIIIIAIAGIIITETIWKKRITTRFAPNAVSTILLTLILCSGLLIASTNKMMNTAIKHGYEKGTHKMPIAQIWDGIDHSMEESELPDDLTNKIVIYQKFGCPDCAGIFTDLVQAVKDRDDVYWVSTRSDTGKALREQYPVTDVPAGIYIRNDKTYATVQLYKKISDQSVLDTDNLQELFNYVH